MPIVVKHEPSAAAVLGMSRIAGEGAFNKWKTEFEARQQQYGFQNLMSGLSGGMGLAQPFIQSAQQQAGRDHQMAMYELKKGDQLAKQAKLAKSTGAGLNFLFGPDGPLANSDGTAAIPKETIAQIVQNPDLASRMLSSGVGALQSQIVAEQALHPDRIRQRVGAQIAEQQAVKQLQVQEIEKLQGQLLGDKSFHFTRGRDGKLQNPDPQVMKAYNALEGQKRRIKYGTKPSLEKREQANVLDKGSHLLIWNDKTGTFTLAQKPKKESEKPSPHLPLPRSGGPAGTQWPEEGPSPQQAEKWRSRFRDNRDHIEERDKPDEGAILEWRNQLDKLNGMKDTQRSVLLDPTAEESAKQSARQNMATLDAEIDAERQRRPAGRKSAAQIKYEAELETFMETRLPPPWQPGWKPRPFGYGRQPRSWMDETIKPNIRAWVKGLPQNATYRDAAAYMNQQSGGRYSREQILEILRNSYERMGGEAAKSPQRALQESGIPAEAIRKLMSGQAVTRDVSPGPGEGFGRGPLLPEGEEIPGTGLDSLLGTPRPDAPAPDDGSVPADETVPDQTVPDEPDKPVTEVPEPATPAKLATPVKGYMPDISRVAGDAIANNALMGLNSQFGGTPDRDSGVIRGVQKFLNDPKIEDDLKKWVFTGRKIKDFPGAKKLFAEVEKIEKAFSRRGERGGAERSFILPQDLSGNPNLGYSENQRLKAIGGRQERLNEILKKRRDRLSGVIEAAVKWSIKAKSPLSLSNIPAPATNEEFNRLAQLRLIKAGDIIIQPPHIEKGVPITDARFMRVSEQAIIKAIFNQAQRQVP